MPSPSGDDENVTLAQLQSGRIFDFQRHASAEHVEELVAVRVRMPNERASDLGDFHLVVVDRGDQLGGPGFGYVLDRSGDGNLRMHSF